MASVELKEWEQAEIERSALEAANAAYAELRASRLHFERYAAPPRETIFPLEYAFHLLGDIRHLSVLELGCGSGENTVLLAGRGAKLYALDISSELVSIARRRVEANDRSEGVEFIVASAHTFPFPDESIDVVFGIAILHHLDLARTAAEVRRVLRPGGRAIFQEPVRNSSLLRLLRRLIPYRAQDVSPFERPLTDGEMSEFARGYQSYHSRPFGLPYQPLADLLPLAPHHRRALWRLDSELLARLPALGHYAMIRVVEMTKEG